MPPKFQVMVGDVAAVVDVFKNNTESVQGVAVKLKSAFISGRTTTCVVKVLEQT